MNDSARAWALSGRRVQRKRYWDTIDDRLVVNQQLHGAYCWKIGHKGKCRIAFWLHIYSIVRWFQLLRWPKLVSLLYSNHIKFEPTHLFPQLLHLYTNQSNIQKLLFPIFPSTMSSNVSAQKENLKEQISSTKATEMTQKRNQRINVRPRFLEFSHSTFFRCFWKSATNLTVTVLRDSCERGPLRFLTVDYEPGHPKVDCRWTQQAGQRWRRQHHKRGIAQSPSHQP